MFRILFCKTGEPTTSYYEQNLLLGIWCLPNLNGNWSNNQQYICDGAKIYSAQFMYSQSRSTNKTFLFFCQKVLFVLNSEQNLNNKKNGLEVYSFTNFTSRTTKIWLFFIFKTLFCFSHVQNLKKEETSTTIEWPRIQIWHFFWPWESETLFQFLEVKVRG